MDLNSGKLITRNIVHEIPVTDVVIKAVETMAYAQGFTTLKFKNRKGIIFHDADWIAGVDYEDDGTENTDDDEYQKDEQYQQEVEEDDNINEEELEQIDPGEVEDIILDAKDEYNPTMQNGIEPEQPDVTKQEDEAQDATES